jgi:agmatine/peptidylarginine deiminase
MISRVALRAAVVGLFASLAIAATSAQTVSTASERALNRIQTLIAQRTRDWPAKELQLAPTPPPENGPMRIVPDWELSSGVLVTFDLQSQLALHLAIDLDACTDSPIDLAAVKRHPEYGELTSGKVSDEQLGWLLSINRAVLDMIATLVARVDVVALVPSEGDHESDLKHVIETLGQCEAARPLLVSPRLHFVQVPHDTRWIRDYGPQFARDAKGTLFMLDARYDIKPAVSVSESAEIASLLATRTKDSDDDVAEAEGADRSTAERLQRAIRESHRTDDDLVPSRLAGRFREIKNGLPASRPLSASRPPITLAGGDFQTDGKVAFTSTATLRENGTDPETLEAVFREYFGLDEVVYLMPLPGSTVKHIDMFFEVVGPSTYLLATFKDNGSTDKRIAVQTEAQRVLDVNERILRGFFASHGRRVRVIQANEPVTPGPPDQVTIVRVPIPDARRPQAALIEARSGELREIEERVPQIALAVSRLEAEADATAHLISAWSDRSKALRTISTAPKAPISTLHDILGEIARLGGEDPVDDWAREHRDEWEGAAARVESLKTFIAANEEALVTGTLDGAARAEFDTSVDAMATDCERLVDDLRAFAEDLNARHDRGVQIIREHRSRARHLLVELRSLARASPTGFDIYRTYLNLLFIKGEADNLVLVPTFAGVDELEAAVLKRLRDVYTAVHGPTTIVGVDSDALSNLHGAVHCITRAIPAGVYVFEDQWGVEHMKTDRSSEAAAPRELRKH